ncbi:hypothetical protein [Roseospira navarrensis]|uniref:Uncharacterized protein n=1 Tax=Roseospira navarrensis TaxID=140058 RepID=A0A7X1ZEY6_9PROT|nr:hypothetical protein [Roseospira navarrensis]MQX37334.1 hypothetical protein [Roseospira navarrensis]
MRPVRLLALTCALLAAPETMPGRSLAFAQTMDSPTAEPLPAGGRETLDFDPPPGWVEVFRDDRPRSGVVHLVPPDQSGADWRDMVTVQVLKTPEPPALEALHARARARYEAACDAVRGGGLQTGETNGLDTGFWTLACGTNRDSGLGETAFFKAMRGVEGVYLVQRAWRTDPFDPDQGPALTAEQQRAAIDRLATAVVCVPDSAAYPCP